MTKAVRDPLDLSSFNHQRATLKTGRAYHWVDEFKNSLDEFDPKSTPTLLCMHGFPDSWYSWRHLIGVWVEAGYRVIAPSMLGYGETDKPDDLNAYAMSSISADMAALLDLVGVSKAVIIGHDWGTHCAHRFAQLRPERCLAIVSISMPYYAPSRSYAPLETIVKYAPYMGYHLYLADYSSPREIEANLEAFLALMFQDPTSSYRRRFAFAGELQEYMVGKKDLQWDKPWNKSLSVEETNNMLSIYEKSGMMGPTNWYRTTDARYHDEKDLPNELPQDIPWLLIYGERDVTCPKVLVDKTKAQIQQLKVVVLEGKGHWLGTEAWKELSQNVIEVVESARS